MSDKTPQDINEARFSGMVEEYGTVQTRTGTPMSKGRLRCRQETVIFVAFHDAAKIIVRPGERVEICGRIQSTRWQAPDGAWRNGWQIVAHDIRPAQSPDGGRFRPEEKRSRNGAGAFNRERRPGVMVACEHEDLPF